MNALDKIKILPSAFVAENAPLGVEAANNAGIPCIVVLNNTPLNIQDFRSIIMRIESSGIPALQDS